MSNVILVVDDEPLIRQQLSILFEKYGFSCFQASSAREAKKILQTERVDLATVDILMPGENGIELTKWIKSTIDIPVIMLTSLDDNIDTVVGLEVGADDYISKPFDPRILLARVNAVIRRYKATRSPDDSATGRIFLNSDQRYLKNGSKKIFLNTREFEFIMLLVDARSASVSRETISRTIFQKDWNPTDRAVDNFVARLRQKIEENPMTPQLIVTVRQVGYMIPEGKIEPGVF